MKSFEFIRQRRKEMGMTQKEVAEKAGLSLSVIRRFEANRPYNPLANKIFKLARAIRVDGNYLLMDCDWPE
ncbi:Helix-turn-helix domain-containing protein [Aneurinibacillus thermoaerophilus]|uniref:Helix-turn-helix domain-containing protein n=1 Tax=Aneurinibacillus thermoaerophilus TaxID=143495 RepID=A0A1G8FK89_ANETH|nr:helix-turn-helix transcriptional regulator [Aneurinibacillus thermoaerophilus]SDH82583.1 Helix-turn-helix domain-containing protein [Aneurinibacillus thermoaerophilus]